MKRWEDRRARGKKAARTKRKRTGSASNQFKETNERVGVHAKDQLNNMDLAKGKMARDMSIKFSEQKDQQQFDQMERDL